MTCHKKMLRCLVPLLGLTLLAIFAELYAIDPTAYYRALARIGIDVWKYPFVDCASGRAPFSRLSWRRG
jgi:hypothetical protein